MKRFIKILVLLLPSLTGPQLYAQLQGRQLIDSMLQELPKQKEDTNKVKLLTTLSFENRSVKPDECLRYAEQALMLATKLDWEKGIGVAYNDMGIGYNGKFDYPSALEYYFKALKTDEEIAYKNGVAKVCNNIGNIYLENEDYAKGLEYYFKGIKISEETGDKRNTALTWGNIGATYNAMSDFTKAMEYFSKALNLNKEIGDKKNVSNFTCEIGNVYLNQGNFTQALDYYYKALKIMDENGKPFPLCGVFSGIGSAYLLEFKDSSNQFAKIIGPKKPLLSNKLPNDRKILNLAIEYLKKGLVQGEGGPVFL